MKRSDIIARALGYPVSSSTLYSAPGREQSRDTRGSGATRKGQWGRPPLICHHSRPAREREIRAKGRVSPQIRPRVPAPRNIACANVLCGGCDARPTSMPARASGQANDDDPLAPPSPACFAAKPSHPESADVSMAAGAQPTGAKPDGGGRIRVQRKHPQGLEKRKGEREARRTFETTAPITDSARTSTEFLGEK
jgi:hypothetical protein